MLCGRTVRSFANSPRRHQITRTMSQGRRPEPSAEDREKWRKHMEESPALCLAYVKEHAEQGNPKSVVDAIDEFRKTRPMMNIGAVKGAIVDEQIRLKKPLVMAELGSYSGYSAVRFAGLQREVTGPNAHYYAFEFSPTFADVVREMVAFAGLADNVTVTEGPFSDNWEVLKGKTVDIYFIDHEKSVYLTDAKIILESGTLKKGSVLAADNVLIPGAPDYVEFLQNHKQFTNVMNEAPHSFGVDAVMVSEFQG